MDERIKLLTSMPVFGGMNTAAMELLTDLAEPVTVPAGKHFFREGEKSQTMYVLQSGQVEIYKTWQSTSKLLRCMRAGDCFGEMALIDLFPRSASALAVESCDALQITPSILQEIYVHDLEQFTLLQMNMGREISRRLREVDELLFRTLMGEALPETTLSYLS
ncbi:MAG: cyclic nucleotide-binding domain-containing protein [Gammaproteobacteria bacterium]|nr:cyclic nucleotide-binding domain-containing protein [Gammaproteobacteria bacterium]